MDFPVRSIRRQIIVLILISVLPALGIIVYTGLEQRREAIERSSSDIRGVTQNFALQQEQISGSTRQLLMALSEIPAVVKGDVQSCNDLFRKLLAQNPCYAAINIATREGKVFASAPRMPSYSIADRKYFKDVLQKGDFAVGSYMFSRPAGRPVLHFAYPVVDKKSHLVSVLVAAFDVSYYDLYISTTTLPEGSVFAVTDSGGVRLYRYPEFKTYVGQKDLSEMLERMSSRAADGSFFATGVDGRRRLYGYKHLHLSRGVEPDMFIRIGVPEEIVLAEANHNLVRNLEILAVTALFAMGLAYLVGNHMIIKPIQVLVKASRQIGQGELMVRTGLADGKSEIGRLARSFDEMATLLEDRDAERRWAEEKILGLKLEREQVLNSAGEGIIGVNADGDLIFVNPAAARMLGYEVDEMIGKNGHSIFHRFRADGSPYPENECPVYNTYREGKTYHAADDIFWKKDGGHFPVEYTSTPIIENKWPVGAVLTFRDITERLRSERMIRREMERENALLSLYEEASRLEENDLYDKTLDLAVRLTDSVIGFFHRVSDDQQQIILTTWNSEARKKCTAPQATHYPISEAGNWVDCVRFGKVIIYNDFRHSPNQKGLPDGHTPVERFMSIPVMEDDKVRIIFGVGNKKEAYDENDAAQIQIIAAELNKIIRQLKSDKNLKESEELYRMLAEKSMAGVYVVQDSKFLFLNTNAASYAGYLPEELIGVGSIDIIHPEDRARARSAAIDMLKGKDRSPYEFRVRTKDGGIRWIMESVAGIQYGGRPAILGNAMDITDIIQARRELESQKALESSIMDAIPHAVIGQRNRLIIFANDRVRDVFGWTPEELVGKETRVLYGSDDVYEEIGETVYGAMKDRRTYMLERPCLRKDGREILCRLNAAVVGDRLRERNIVVIYEDITAAVQADKERRKIETHLRQSQKMEAIGTLAGGIAHDFNNILTGIMGYAELYKDQVQDKPQVYRGMEEILNASMRAKDLVRQILSFSRQREEEKNPIRVTPIMKEVVKFMRASLPATIQIRQRLDTAGDKIMADATQIHQVLMNLCANAGYAMRNNGGVLDVSLEQADLDGDAGPEHAPPTGVPYLKLTVQDTGCGIKPEHMERIFEPYFTTKEAGEGTGLGLAVVHGIVKSHGGEIKVYSEPDKGTAFHVYLPLLPEQPAAESRMATEPLPRGDETILLVDDEKMLAQLQKLTLENLGYNVVAETNPAAAVALFRENKDGFDLVITDKTMPQMTGFDMAREIKSIRADIPIILCSGFQDKEDAAKLSASGIDHYITKPIRTRVIAETIRLALLKSRPAGQNS